jgi:hypothetical protein
LSGYSVFFEVTTIRSDEMKRCIFLVIYCFFHAFVSDDAPVFPVQSGNVIPVNNDDIQLKEEQIDIF